MQKSFTSSARPTARSRAPSSHSQKPSKAPQNPQWKILGDLVTAMRYLPINAGAIATLRALLSCRSDGSTVVYAGNRCLAKRADGIEERTLTRHLTHLCKIGFLLRKSSPNGKRFAKRRAQGQVEVYGIDLAPFLERATELAILARRAEEEDRLIAHLRDVLSELRYLLQTNGLSAELVEELALQRRRKADLPVLRALELRARSVLEDAGIDVLSASPEDIPSACAGVLSVNDSQNVCHIQSHPNKESQPRAFDDAERVDQQNVDSVLKKEGREDAAVNQSPGPQSREDLCRYADEVLAGFRAKLAGEAPARETQPICAEDAAKQNEATDAPSQISQAELNAPQTTHPERPRSGTRMMERQSAAPGNGFPLRVEDVLAACPIACSLETIRPRSWPDLVAFAWKIGGWLGFPGELMAEACASLGREGLAVTLLGLCERQDKLRQPAAYLRSVMRRPGFQPASLLGFGPGDLAVA